MAISDPWLIAAGADVSLVMTAILSGKCAPSNSQSDDCNETLAETFSKASVSHF